MPASDKGQEGKNQFLGKSIAYLSMRYEDQQKQTIEDMDEKLPTMKEIGLSSLIIMSERKISTIQSLVW